MEEILQNKENNDDKKYPTIIVVIIVVILIIIGFFLYTSTYDITLLERTSDKKVFSEEEKFEILDSLSKDSENTLSIEEKRSILNDISNNKAEDAYNYSEEGKLQILRSLEEE